MIRAVIADDSPLLRQMLSDILSDNGIVVAGAAENGRRAVELVRDLKPDILVLDCEMPVMGGLEALQIIMSQFPLPVFIFSSYTREGAAITIRALELGAVDFLLKPSGAENSLEAVTWELIQKIRLIVVKSRFGLIRRQSRGQETDPRKNLGLRGVQRRAIDIIAVGSSTGGVQAAEKILTLVPENTKPIVWVQHMPPNFIKSFADRLNALSRVSVAEAKDGDLLENGRCYIAAGGVQTRVVKVADRCRLRVAGAEKVSGHCPSCNVLFESVSRYFGKNAMGVILTGMGDDGAAGLSQMHSNGSFVVGQSEPSCVVYGMPKAAFALGAVDLELDLQEIPEAISKMQGLDGRPQPAKDERRGAAGEGNL